MIPPFGHKHEVVLSAEVIFIMHLFVCIMGIIAIALSFIAVSLGNLRVQSYQQGGSNISKQAGYLPHAVEKEGKQN